MWCLCFVLVEGYCVLSWCDVFGYLKFDVWCYITIHILYYYILYYTLLFLLIYIPSLPLLQICSSSLLFLLFPPLPLLLFLIFLSISPSQSSSTKLTPHVLSDGNVEWCSFNYVVFCCSCFELVLMLGVIQDMMFGLGLCLSGW